jgi:DNA helicase-2/ATP-dependent DNA helicase PcrA
MIYATGRMLYGTTQHNTPSRFLSEIDAAYVEETSTGVSFAGMAGGGGYDTYDDTNYQAPAAPVVDDGPRYVPDFEIGDGVRHQLFGEGTIVELEGETATIYFKGKGPKRLNIGFAPLEKL